jgi:uncharacterized protein YyaL (SSP411 family)
LIQGAKPNRLIGERSPYLLQHAYNPVDWYPWCQEAFERARREDKPIFLSIGYSTCHWCHVMAEESFEDPEVAALLNDTFVCIKVDREERPDIDAVYMQVCQLMTGSGGWPLTIIMTPDCKPFYAATYIPKTSRFGMVGLKDLVPRVSELWATRRGELIEASDSVVSALRTRPTLKPAEQPGEKVLREAYGRLYEEFDETHGGFGVQPKFPMPHRLRFLLRYYYRYHDAGALYIVEKTLQRIRFGGIFDQVGGGVHRYSTDQRWMVPHFEKMLYDQAGVALASIEAYQVTHKEFYGQLTREVLDFTLRELSSAEGGYYTALDADSEGVEGKYYLWTWSELSSVLSEPELKLMEEYYNVSRDGNIEVHGSLDHPNILHAEISIEEYCSKTGCDPKSVGAQLDAARRKLFEARQKRVRPNRDNKILADLNGYMVAALAKASIVLGSTLYLERAEEAAAFVLDKMTAPDGGLYHTYAGGKAYVEGLLGDYAFMVWGLIELYEASFRPGYLREALRLNQYMVEHFWDEGGGGFYLTSDKAESTLVRPKDFYDGATPSANSVALTNLLRLSRTTGQTGLEETAQRLLEALAPQLEGNPEAFTHSLSGLDYAIGPTKEVVVVGDMASEKTKTLLNAIQKSFLPNVALVCKAPGHSALDELCPYTQGMRGVVGDILVYVCSNFSCRTPTSDVERVLGDLGVGGGHT